MNHSFWEIIWNASLVGKIVMIVLVVASLISWAIWYYYLKAFKQMKEDNRLFDNLGDPMRSADLMVMEHIYQNSSKFHFSPKARVFRNVYDQLIKFNEDLISSGKGDIFGPQNKISNDYMQRSVSSISIEFFLPHEKYRSYLATIASVSPFIGLFGTVWGIVDSFRGLAMGQGTLEAVAPGIAEALIATAAGLAASIPASIFFNFVSGRFQEYRSTMTAYGQDLINLFERVMAVGLKK
ncbi:MAG: MotA/TolQ/ExbB proton channel family protein [Bacteriovoracaceae bacterium]|nr:MotA/TolQ/ExbB proton channel family protein [Bacteriovoracaceae bacterium]